MRFRSSLLVLVVLVAPTFAGFTPSQVLPTEEAPHRQSVDVTFVENVGQWPEGIRFGAFGRGLLGFVSECRLVLPSSDVVSFEGCDEARHVESVTAADGAADARTRVYRAGHGSNAVPVDRARVLRQADAYPGVNIVWHGDDRGRLEFDLEVRDAGDLSQVRLTLPSDARLARDGAVEFDGSGGLVELHPPRSWQGGDEKNVLASSYRAVGNRVAFEVSGSRAGMPVTVDPVIEGASYFGGGLHDHISAVAVDAQGHLIVAGQTASEGSFPLKNPVQGFGGGFRDTAYDAFVSAFDLATGALVYSTFLGGDNVERVFGLAVDGQGAAYIAVQSEWLNYPTVGAPPGQAGNLFVTKLDAAGTIVYSVPVYWGTPRGIAVDAARKAYVVGLSYADGAGLVKPIRATQQNGEAFLAKLSANGTVLYSTFLGGSDLDWAYGVAVDRFGSPHVVGGTRSADFGVTPGASQPSHAGGGPTWLDSQYLEGDAFVTKLNPSGASLKFSTFLGGSAADQAHGVAVDPAGRVLVAGATTSQDFPLQHALQTRRGPSDAFISGFDPNGTRLFSTVLGGEGDDAAYGLALDPDGLDVVGWTTSRALPNRTLDAPLRGDMDAFVSVLSPVVPSRLVASSYLGGATPVGILENERALGVAVDTLGTVHVAGMVETTDFPTWRAFQSTYQGGAFWPEEHPSIGDGFFAAMSVCRTQPCTTASEAGLPGAAGWWRSNVTVSLFSECVCEAITWVQADDRPWVPATALDVTGDGVHVVRSHGRTPRGVDEVVQSRVVRIDTTPPSVAFEQPTSGLYVMGTSVTASADAGPAGVRLPAIVVGNLTVRAAAMDSASGVRGVEFLVDGVLRATDDLAPYEFEWSTRSADAGWHVLEARASDVAGNGPAKAQVEILTLT